MRNIDVMKTYTAPTARRLQTSTHDYTWTAVLIADRSSASPLTSDIASISSASEVSLKADIKTQLGSNFTVGDYLPSAYAPTQQSVNWTTSPAVASKTSSSVTISFGTDNNYGEVACVVLDARSQSEYETNNNYKPSYEQVFLGLDANRDAANSAKKIDSADDAGTAMTEITLDGLEKGSPYSAFCTVTNGALVWPGFFMYNSYDSYVPLKFSTEGTKDTDDDDDDSALLVSSNIVAICTMIAALIFN